MASISIRRLFSHRVILGNCMGKSSFQEQDWWILLKTVWQRLSSGYTDWPWVIVHWTGALVGDRGKGQTLLTGWGFWSTISMRSSAALWRRCTKKYSFSSVSSSFRSSYSSALNPYLRLPSCTVPWAYIDASAWRNHMPSLTHRQVGWGRGVFGLRSGLAGQVLMSFYVILYRIAMAEAKSEVNKTRHFVSMIPLHVLDREVSILLSFQQHE